MNIRSMGTMAATILLSAAWAGCDALPEQVAQDARRRQLGQAGLESFDTTGRFGLAGMSAIRQIDLEELDRRKLAGDTLGRSFGVFSARCGACHAVPAPGAKEAFEWAAVMTRMRHNAKEAGLLPMTQDDHVLVLEYLEKHSRMR